MKAQHVVSGSSVGASGKSIGELLHEACVRLDGTCLQEARGKSTEFAANLYGMLICRGHT